MFFYFCSFKIYNLKMKKIMLLIMICNSLFSQNKNRYIIGTFHEKNTTIYGVSMGAFSTLATNFNAKTYGLRLEVPGIGFLFMLFPNDFELNQPKKETIYGINISLTGGLGANEVIGLNLNGIVSYDYNQTGLSLAALANSSNFTQGIQISSIVNLTNELNGIQIAILHNESENGAGIQISLYNKNLKLKGVQIGILNKSNSNNFQIGLWNKNLKRSLPIINF